MVLTYMLVCAVLHGWAIQGVRLQGEYGVDCIKLDPPHGIKDEMALQYQKTLSDCIKGEEWKIYMITEILDCINGIYESNLNEEENLFLLNDLCTL